MTTVPLGSFNLNDVISFFVGPQVDVNYAGSQTPVCAITLQGTGEVTVQYNSTSLVIGTGPIPNPSGWQTLRVVNSVGTVQIPLTPRQVQNWIQVILTGTGTGTCEVEAIWQIPGSVIDPPLFLGFWDAHANTPTLANGVGLNGGYYIVNVTGTTNLDGTASWAIGDHAVFNRTAWLKQPAISIQSP